MFQFVGEVVQTFKKLAIKQEEKGVEKYGDPLNPAHEYDPNNETYQKYDWLEMTREEMVDGFKYIEMEQHRREAKREAIEDVLAKARNLLTEVKAYRNISEGAHDDIDDVIDLIEFAQKVNQR